MKISHPITRRSMLKGGAVALCLPWLETFDDRPASAAAAPIQRYMAVYFPNGTTDSFWLPSTAGTGDAWSVSPLLEPALASKKNMLVLHGVGNYSAFATTSTISPSHGTNSAGAWHCYDARKDPGGGISIDQVIAKQIGAATKLPSLQVGL